MQYSAATATAPDRRFCVAPMMKCTDRYFRRLARFMTKRAVLYTEMLSCKAVIHGHSRGILDYDAVEHPLALQVGGREPAAMAACAELAQRWGYAEFNINAGCPGKCAQAGGFGVALMKMPQQAAACVKAIRDASDLPLSIKCRIGVAGRRGESDLPRFVEANADAGCKVFIVHARLARLDSFSPKQNRTIPPLDYESVYRLKEAFPECEIILNGGILSLQQAQRVRASLDGVMLGRAVYDNPFMLRDADALFYARDSVAGQSGYELGKLIMAYVAKTLREEEASSGRLLKHLLNLFKGQRHARNWRRWLSNEAAVATEADFMRQFKTRFERMLESTEGEQENAVVTL